jgi:hypothetical protein
MDNKSQVNVKIKKISAEHVAESDRMLAFTETPSGEHHDRRETADNEICACDLFSFFTADIIKSDIVFAR